MIIMMIMIMITLVINTITISIIFHHDNVVNNVRVHLSVQVEPTTY